MTRAYERSWTRICAEILLAASLLAASTAEAATYFVRNGGDDNADGLTHDTAWATLDKVGDFNFRTGDRLLFHEGGRWEGQISVSWSGTEDEPAVVGSYYLRNGVPTPGYRTARPVIDGTDTIPGRYDGLIRVQGSHVRISDMATINSEGRGIRFLEAPYGEVTGCLTSNTWESGIKFVDSPHAIVRGNFVTLAGLAGPQDGRPRGGAIELVRSDYGIIDDNTVVEVHGEGINSNDGSVGAIIENNYVFGARSVGIYLDTAPNSTVRRNVVVGTANPEFWRQGETTGAGIAVNNEVYHYTQRGLSESVQSRGAKIYGNMVAYTSSGLSFWGEFDGTTFDDVLVFNNTLVDNDTQVRFLRKPKPGSMLVNNILLSLSPGTRDVDINDLSGMVAMNNYFSRGNPGGDLSHPGNVYRGLRLARMSGWRSINDYYEDVQWEDFKVLEGSSVIKAGHDEPRQMVTNGHDFDVDYAGLRHGAPMDIGALHFPDADYKTPKRPTNVVGRP